MHNQNHTICPIPYTYTQVFEVQQCLKDTNTTILVINELYSTLSDDNKIISIHLYLCVCHERTCSSCKTVCFLH